ncbi:AMP-binding protein [Massilia sp. MB5]|uniref:AMP-binding protein n=1 Tax=Massilia sp. MB5 TaxID=2919578 RepID=UPI0027D93C50|nr:AMP-binding protein [Massilia sp. MB5]
MPALAYYCRTRPPWMALSCRWKARCTWTARRQLSPPKANRISLAKLEAPTPPVSWRTSGSTGRPKGVTLTHAALINYAQHAAAEYGIHTGDRILQFASIAFDASLEESLIAYRGAATLVLRPERMLDSTAAFVRETERLQLTMMVLPTAYWHELIATLDTHPLPPRLRCIVIGGERAIPEKLARWQELTGGRIQVFNTYGPTEGTIAVTRGLLPAQPGDGPAGREVMIGRPVANSTVYVLDRHLHPVPHGVPGEIYLGGAALARDYLHQAGLTAERFLPSRSRPGRTSVFIAPAIWRASSRTVPCNIWHAPIPR